MKDTSALEPPIQSVRMRLTRTDLINGRCYGILDMDGIPIGRIQFASTDAADAYQAFLARLCRRP